MLKMAIISVVNPITSDVLLTNKSLVHTPRRKNVTFTPLDDDEIPTAGTVVGLDAEFVTLNQVSGNFHLSNSIRSAEISTCQTQSG